MTQVIMKLLRGEDTVSVSNVDGEVDGDGRVFISGIVMNELVCHNKVMKKFVYDETVFFKDSWGNSKYITIYVCRCKN